MKYLIQLFALFTLSFNLAAQQPGTVVGKWSIVKIKVDGLVLDPANPEKTKKDLAVQMEKDTGTKPSASEVNEAYEELLNAFTATTFEFTTDGKAITRTVDGDEKLEEVSKYTVDYTKGTLVTTTWYKEDNYTEKRSANIRFVNGLLVMKFEKSDDNSVEEMTLKRIN